MTFGSGLIITSCLEVDAGAFTCLTVAVSSTVAGVDMACEGEGGETRSYSQVSSFLTIDGCFYLLNIDFYGVSLSLLLIAVANLSYRCSYFTTESGILNTYFAF